MLSRRTFLQSALLLPAAFTYSSSARAQEATPGTAPAQSKPATEVFADFEGGTYDGWTIEGDAFGTAPATDALFPNQIAGYAGRGFLCSLHATRATLPSARRLPASSRSRNPSFASKSAAATIPARPA